VGESSPRDWRRLSNPTVASALLRGGWRQGLLPDEAVPPNVAVADELRCHPGSRCTLRYILADGRTWIAKYYARPRPRLAALYDMLSGPSGVAPAPISVPRMIAYFPRARVLFQQSACGAPLTWLLHAGQAEAVSMAAYGLAALARAPLPLPAAYTLRHPLTRAHRWVVRLSLAAPELASAAARLLAALSDACPAWPTPPRLIHGDLSAAHVFIAERGVELVDWDDAHPGDPAEDAGRLLTSLLHLGVRGKAPPQVIARARTAFTSTYAREAAEIAPRVPFYVALACLRKASRLVARPSPQRSPHSAALLTAGLSALREARRPAAALLP
jgi:phosphotransferase family enzyme